MTKDNKDSSGANGSNASGGSRHSKYYIGGGDLHFRVGGTQFRVHSYFFLRESRYWQDELAGATHPGDRPLKTGTFDTNEVVLADEKPEEFECLLRVFYNPKYDIYDMTHEDWVIVLKYASKWQFPEVMDLAIRYLELKDMDLIKRIQLYQENQVPRKHLFPLFAQLASREEVLGLGDSQILGLETSVLIYQARERLRAQRSEGDGLRSPIRPDCDQAEISEIVGTTFNIPPEERVFPPEDSDTNAKPDGVKGLGQNSNTRKNKNKHLRS